MIVPHKTVSALHSLRERVSPFPLSSKIRASPFFSADAGRRACAYGAGVRLSQHSIKRERPRARDNMTMLVAGLAKEAVPGGGRTFISHHETRHASGWRATTKRFFFITYSWNSIRDERKRKGNRWRARKLSVQTTDDRLTRQWRVNPVASMVRHWQQSHRIWPQRMYASSSCEGSGPQAARA